jgi:TonB-dependent receptor
MVADVSYSKAKRDELNLENNTQLPPVAGAAPLDTLNLNFATGGFSTLTPTLNYSDPTKLLLRGTIYGAGYGKVPKVEDELKGFRIGGTLPAPAMVSSFMTDVEFGLNYADRAKKKTQPEGNINVGAQGDTPVASDLQYGLVDLGFAGVGSIPSWNVPAAVARYMTFNPSSDAAGYLIAKAWNVNEKITTVYAKANLDTQWGGINVRGNYGLQVQSVDQSSASNYFDNSKPVGQQVKPFNDGKQYTDVLPSLNLAFALGGDQTLRFAAARQVARPRVDQLRSALDFGVDSATGLPGASGGNPRLDPWRADALDLSYEKYFGTKGYVSAAVFYKNLKSYIYTQSTTDDFASFIAGYVPPVGSTVQAQRFGQLTAPQNGNGGRLQGVELTASLPLGMLTPVLSGFGIVASASITDSNIKIKDPDSASSVGSGPISLPGLSKNVVNLTAYYEQAGFEARISQRRRSDFIGEIGNFSGSRILRYVVGENITDAQIGYNFNDGQLKGLSLLLQVNNLGDAAYKTYSGSKDRPLEYIKWGRSYLMGANYKF